MISLAVAAAGWVVASHPEITPPSNFHQIRDTTAAWAAGQIPTPDVPVEWSPPKFEAVDPQKDAMANLLAIRSGTMTLAEVIARQGRNPDAVLAEIAATNAKLDALGLVLDSDPRRVTKTGSAQSVGSNGDAGSDAQPITTD